MLRVTGSVYEPKAMPVRAELSAVAWPPPLMVVVTVLVAVEMTEIEPV